MKYVYLFVGFLLFAVTCAVMFVIGTVNIIRTGHPYSHTNLSHFVTLLIVAAAIMIIGCLMPDKD